MNLRSLTALGMAAVGALALSLAPVQQAGATTFAPMSVEQVTDASEYIVRGTITEVWTELGDDGRVWTRARLSVSETLKGPDAPSELIIDSMGGTHAGTTLTVPGQAVFSEHEDTLVFLTELKGRFVPVGKFLGKYTVRRAPDDTRHHVLRWHPQAGVKFDARFLPHPAKADRVYLDDLVEQVQTRLDVGWDHQPIPGISPERLETINAPQRRTP